MRLSKAAHFNFSRFVAGIFVAAIGVASAASRADARKCVPVSGHAVDTKTGAPAFTENYDLECKDGEPSSVKVHFENAQGKLIVEESASFHARPYLPETDFHDLRDDYRYRVRLNGKAGVEIEESFGRGRGPKIHEISDAPELMTYLGAMRFMGENIERLGAGETLTAKLIVPSRHAAYSVRFRAKREPSARLAPGMLEVQIELTNPLYRFFAPEMQLVYSLKDGALRSFKGNAPILDEHEKPIPVEIKYVAADDEKSEAEKTEAEKPVAETPVAKKAN